MNNKVSGVVFKGAAGVVFVSDSEPLVYKWNRRLKLWCYCYLSRNLAINEQYIREMHSGIWYDALVDRRKLASGIRAK